MHASGTDHMIHAEDAERCRCGKIRQEKRSDFPGIGTPLGGT